MPVWQRDAAIGDDTRPERDRCRAKNLIYGAMAGVRKDVDGLSLLTIRFSISLVATRDATAIDPRTDPRIDRAKHRNTFMAAFQRVSMFDTDEYLHLALHASSKGDLHACISYLRELLWHEPRNAQALYLLALQHAEIGLSDRAINGMQCALDIDSTLEVARFQLALLLMHERRTEEASEQFFLLCSAADMNLRTSSAAMAALLDDSSPRSRERIVSGLTETTSSLPLAGPMKRILEALTKGDPSEPGPSLSDSEIRFGA